MTFAETVAAALNRGAFADLERTYLHRARREDSLTQIVGRDAIIADDLNLAASLTAADVIQFTTSTIVIEGEGLRQHRWSAREGDRILTEWVVSDRELSFADRLAAAQELGARLPAHPPLGEVRSGRGQLSAGSTSWMRAEPQWLVDSIHRIWNERRLDELETLYAPDACWRGPGGRRGGSAEARSWMLELLARFPDATVLFDRVDDEGDKLAILWRFVAHADAVRMHLLGSSLLTLGEGRIAADDTLIDELALEANAYRPLRSIQR